MSTRTIATVQFELARARAKELRLVERARNDRPKTIARAWAAADSVNVLLCELQGLINPE